MAPNFSRPAELTEEARRIFFIVDGFLRSTSTQKPNTALESFPPSIDSTPWRRVYMAAGIHSTAYLTMEPWNPSELSAGGARGILWFFTELPRIGEKICRKTVDGTQTWSGRSGRAHKNGFPVQILVAKLVIKGTAYHMLELTLDLEKPTVALCKIWRTGTTATDSPRSMNEGTSTPNQVADNLEEESEMQIEQPQGVFTKQQLHMPSHVVSTISDHTMCPNYVHPYSTGGCFNVDHIIQQFDEQFESMEQEPHMHEQVASVSQHVTHPNPSMLEEPVKMPEDVLSTSDYVVVPTEDIIQSTDQDDVSIYQAAVSYLYEVRDAFKDIVLHGRKEAHELASKAESLASAVKSLINPFPFLGINIERGNTRPASTTNNNQIRTTTEGVTEQSMQANESIPRGEFLDQEMAHQMEDYSMEDDYFNVDDFSIQEGAKPTNFDDQDTISNYF